MCRRVVLVLRRYYTRYIIHNRILYRHHCPQRQGCIRGLPVQRRGIDPGYWHGLQKYPSMYNINILINRLQTRRCKLGGSTYTNYKRIIYTLCKWYYANGLQKRVIVCIIDTTGDSPAALSPMTSRTMLEPCLSREWVTPRPTTRDTSMPVSVAWWTRKR